MAELRGSVPDHGPTMHRVNAREQTIIQVWGHLFEENERRGSTKQEAFEICDGQSVRLVPN